MLHLTTRICLNIWWYANYEYPYCADLSVLQSLPLSYAQMMNLKPDLSKRINLWGTRTTIFRSYWPKWRVIEGTQRGTPPIQMYKSIFSQQASYLLDINSNAEVESVVHHEAIV
jgi:hypothetical protein